MRFEIANNLFDKYQNMRLGVIITENIDNKGENKEIASMVFDVQKNIRSMFTSENIPANGTIDFWRKTYASFGSKPSDFRCSAEALIRTVIKGRDIRHVNKVVDLYNFISMKHIIPSGGEDLDKIEGNLYLKYADGDETFVPLGSDRQENPDKGEVIYVDDNRNVICRRWNWRESDKTKLTEGTKNAIVVIEGFDNTVDISAKELSFLIEKFCYGNNKIFLLDKNTNYIEW